MNVKFYTWMMFSAPNETDEKDFLVVKYRLEQMNAGQDVSASCDKLLLHPFFGSNVGFSFMVQLFLPDDMNFIKEYKCLWENRVVWNHKESLHVCSSSWERLNFCFSLWSIKATILRTIKAFKAVLASKERRGGWKCQNWTRKVYVHR